MSVPTLHQRKLIWFSGPDQNSVPGKFWQAFRVLQWLVTPIDGPVIHSFRNTHKGTVSFEYHKTKLELCLFIINQTVENKTVQNTPLLSSFRKWLQIRGFLFEFFRSSLKFRITIWTESNFTIHHLVADSNGLQWMGFSGWATASGRSCKYITQTLFLDSELKLLVANDLEWKMVTKSGWWQEAHIIIVDLYGNSWLGNITWEHDYWLRNITINLETWLLTWEHDY